MKKVKFYLIALLMVGPVLPLVVLGFLGMWCFEGFTAGRYAYETVGDYARRFVRK